jgi:hypothetical protein
MDGGGDSRLREEALVELAFPSCRPPRAYMPTFNHYGFWKRDIFQSENLGYSDHNLILIACLQVRECHPRGLQERLSFHLRTLLPRPSCP